MTVARACEHIENYTSGHETRLDRLGEDRLDYPPGHIESDNRLSWFLGRLDARFGNDAVYVHLTRDPERVAESYNRRWTYYGSIMSAYGRGILQTRNEGIDIARDYVRTVTENIEHFLAGKTRVHRIDIDEPVGGFRDLWHDLGAQGDLDAALAEFSTRHNESATKPENMAGLTRADRLAIVLEKERRMTLVERAQARSRQKASGGEQSRLREECDTLHADNKDLVAARKELRALLKEIRKDRLFRLIPAFRKYRKRRLEADERVALSQAKRGAWHSMSRRTMRSHRDTVWERALWSPYEDHAMSAFTSMLESEDRNAHIRAHWALARKQGSQRQAADALGHLSSLRGILDSSEIPADFKLYEAAMHDMSGHADGARALIDESELMGAPFVEIALARASNASASGRPIGDWLAAINPLFERAGIAQLTARDPEDPPRFSNLTHDVPAHPRSNEAKVSVIMPAYGAEQTIDYAIDSVLGQTWTNLELLIVDDASQDGTWARIEARAATDDRIVPIRRDVNEGAYACRNAGLRAATGRFVTVNDADDWSHPERIAMQAVQALDSGFACNTTLCCICDEHLRSEPRHRRPHSVLRNTSSFLFSRETALTLGGWDQVRHSADTEFLRRMQRAIGVAETKIVPDTPLAFVYARPGSLQRSGPTSLLSASYGARAEYHEAFTHWHEISENLALGAGRPFPVPAITKERAPQPAQVAVLLVSDFSVDASCNLHLEVLQEMANAERGVGLLHLPTISNIKKEIVHPVRSLIHAEGIPLIVPGMDAECDCAVLIDANGLATPPRGLGQLRADTVYALREPDRSIADAVRHTFTGATEIKSVAGIRDVISLSFETHTAVGGKRSSR